MSMFMQKYIVNTSSNGDPKLYLGVEIRNVEYINGYYAWTMSLDSYYKQAIRNIKKYMKYEKMEFNKKLSDII